MAELDDDAKTYFKNVFDNLRKEELCRNFKHKGECNKVLRDDNIKKYIEEYNIDFNKKLPTLLDQLKKNLKIKDENYFEKIYNYIITLYLYPNKINPIEIEEIKKYCRSNYNKKFKIVKPFNPNMKTFEEEEEEEEEEEGKRIEEEEEGKRIEEEEREEEERIKDEEEAKIIQEYEEKEKLGKLEKEDKTTRDTLNPDSLNKSNPKPWWKLWGGKGGKRRKTNRRKTNRRKTNRRKTNRRKTNRRKTNRRKTSRRKNSKRKLIKKKRL